MTVAPVPRVPAAGPERRAAFRAFVRTHHPDVGGDPAAFVAGLASFADVTGADVTGADVTGADVTGAAGGDRRDDRSSWPAPDDPRLDAPITAVRGGAVHRFGRAGRRLIRRYDPRPGSSRVV